MKNSHEVADAGAVLASGAPVCRRPMRALLQLSMNRDLSPFGRLLIQEHAATSVHVIQQGLVAVGHLLSQSSASVEAGAVPAECIESLGTFMAELNDLAAECYAIARNGSSGIAGAGKEAGS